MTTKEQPNNKFPFAFRQVLRFAKRIHFGQLIFVLPDGEKLHFSGEEETDSVGIIQVNDYRFARRVLVGGDIGFYESYADGDWSTPNLADCLYIFARNADHIQGAFNGSPLLDLVNNLRHAWNKNTKSGSRRNIMAHYDLGNSFYQEWLDPTMTYSSALFPSPDADLNAAQLNKYENLARSIDLNDSDHVLEIGSGWGGFAEYAAKNYGARITGLTVSPAQYDFAKRRIFEAGLTEKVDFKLQDYRDSRDTFDKIASIEMFEAVGKEYWETYFEKVRNALKPGGIAGLQIITIADRFFDQYSKSTDFIQRYVFPGGALPSESILQKLISQSDLTLRKANPFGLDYARTLNEWHKQFLKKWDNIQSLGFDDRFKSLWQFYLAYCEAGFKAGTTNVSQFTLARN
ncbi:class I SAM-dependent methyltransferase [Hyphococcus lacteus]|uniref:Cyclopropane-fatty-acyl-phospholipid synthase family protein n=1 Tax=Hyphococcus lacteus TaxID=3143536 RepID=A0ABV3Z6J2_9PROT